MLQRTFLRLQLLPIKKKRHFELRTSTKKVPNQNYDMWVKKGMVRKSADKPVVEKSADKKVAEKIADKPVVESRSLLTRWSLKERDKTFLANHVLFHLNTRVFYKMIVMKILKVVKNRV